MHINPRLFFSSIYIFCNIIACCFFLESGVLGGDFKGYPVEDSFVLVILALFVMCSYIVFLHFIFPLIDSISYKKKQVINLNLKFHIFVLFIQLFFVLYCLFTGAYIAGSTVTVNNPIKYLWIFLPVDYFFLVYYVTAREHSFFKYNLAIYILSNVVRGWSGFFVYVIFLEMCYFFVVRKNKISTLKLVLISSFLIMIVPIIISVKWAVRAESSLDIHTLGSVFYFAITNLFYGAESISFLDVFTNFATIIIERLQHLANVYVLYINSENFSSSLYDLNYLPFFMEGLPQYIIIQSLGFTYVDLHTWLPGFVYGDKFSGINNSFHTGMVGWLVISTYMIPFYFIYVILLTFTALILVKRLNYVFGPSLVWLCCLMFLMNGWFNAFINLIIALLWFNFLFSIIKNR